VILIITIGLLLFAGIQKVQSDDCGGDQICYKYKQIAKETGVEYREVYKYKWEIK